MDVLLYAIAGLCGLALVFWLATAALALEARRRVPSLADVTPELPEPPPRVSVVVPACDEAGSIESVIRAHLVSTSPALEVIAVDDRSTDATGAILDRIAATEPRARVLHVDALPDGWLGKVHAMERGREAAAGAWILFVDADVRLEPGALGRAMTFALRERLDFLTAIPAVTPAGPLVDGAVTAFLRALFVGGRVWQIADPAVPRAGGFGAFLLVRREALERTEGLEWLRLEVADDVALGLLLKRSGARCGVIHAAGAISLPLYPTLADLARSMEKSGFAILGRYSFARTAATALISPLIELAPLAALLSFGPGWLLALGVVTWATAFGAGRLADRWLGRPLRDTLLAPAGSLLLAGLILRSGWIGWRRGGIRWRGTFYPAERLRAGMRVTWP